ncbi:MAG: hypothetical protein KGZ71_08390 [Desulfobulbaceae bacterium]|nr:hypothetical protein [Desulfobulbaceae bacterium]
MKSKNQLLIYTLIAFMYFQSCENDDDILPVPSVFEMTILYPNPISNNDTLTLGLNYYQYAIKTDNLNDFKVKYSKNDTLIVIGLYDKHKLEPNNRIIGSFNSDDEKVKLIMKHSTITLQCLVNDLPNGDLNIEVENNGHTTSNKLVLYKY